MLVTAPAVSEEYFLPQCKIRIEAQGVTINAIASEKSIAALEPIVKKIVDANPKQAEQLRAGKTGLMGYFVGQVMKETKGSANPQLVNELLKKALGV